MWDCLSIRGFVVIFVNVCYGCGWKFDCVFGFVMGCKFGVGKFIFNVVFWLLLCFMLSNVLGDSWLNFF